MAPLPTQATRLRPSLIKKLLVKYRYPAPCCGRSGRRTPHSGALAYFRHAEAASEICLLLIARFRLLHQQKIQITRRVEAILDQLTSSSADADTEGRGVHRDVELLRSLPGVGRTVAATMLAEASQLLGSRDYHALRAYAGTAPVTRQSGKKTQIHMRYGCNHRLRNVLYYWSQSRVKNEERSRRHYHRLRRAGHSQGRALRGVADRLLAVLIAMLRAQTIYDPERRNVGERPGIAITENAIPS